MHTTQTNLRLSLGLACRATGVLFGVELGEVSVSQQSDLQKVLDGYSFFDGTLGMVSLLVLILLINGWLGIKLNDGQGSVLFIVLTVAVVTLLHEEVSILRVVILRGVWAVFSAEGMSALPTISYIRM